ncbi:MAG: GGDEF domain-containing protein [Acidobacteriota bacterium]|nr:GGDEF domain-containing protein [Acidobacteriota bacterium]
MQSVLHSLKQRSAWIVLGVSLAGLAATAFLESPAVASPPLDRWIVVLWLLTATAAVFRPHVESGLVLGAAGLACAAFFYGPFVTAVFGVTTFLAAILVDGQLAGTTRERFQRWRRLLGASASQLAAALAAGWVAWTLGNGSLEAVEPGFYGAAAAAGSAYLAVLAVLEIAQAVDSGGHVPWRDLTEGLVYEASAWAVGTVTAAAAVTLGPRPAWLLLAAVTVCAVELVRRERLFRVASGQARRLRELQLAGHRIIFGESDLLSIARQIFAECRRVVPFSWFHFQLAGDGGWQDGWWSGPEGMVREGRPDPPAEPPPLPGIHRRASWKILTRTLASGERTVGRLRLWCDPRRLDDDAEEWLDALLPEMTSSILGAVLDREARHDPLTGLPDRRALEERLHRAFRRSQQEGVAAAVIMCDLDRFKRINDKYGHATGDMALTAMARLLEEQQRDDDLCCRYGGEEFSVVLEKTDGVTALAVAERLRHAVENHVFTVDGKKIPLRVSAGVAAFPELHVKESLELLELADVALYEAKRQGRNRCLLNLGRGRFREVDGEVLDPEDPPPEIQAPTLFA